MITTNKCSDPDCPSYGKSPSTSCGCRVNIRVINVSPPVPTGEFDWCAINDDTYDGADSDPIGYGPTKDAAIADLMQQIEAADDRP